MLSFCLMAQIRDIRCCNCCRDSSCDNFKQLASLKASGLVIYIYNIQSKQKRSVLNLECSLNNIILHNTSNNDLQRYDYITELCQYRTKCLKCKMLIQRVRNAIDEISIINKNEVIGVCDFCKRSQQKNKCKRCQYIVEKFLHNKVSQSVNREEQFKLWLSEIQDILLSVLRENVVCKHNNYFDNEMKANFYKLLNYIDSPSPPRQPYIDEFPELFDLKETGIDTGRRKKIIEDLVTKFKNTYDKVPELRLSSSSESESECICKYFGKSKSYEGPSVVSVPKKVSLSSLSMTKSKTITSVENQQSLQQLTTKTKSIKSSKPSLTKKSQLKEISTKLYKKNEMGTKGQHTRLSGSATEKAAHKEHSERGKANKQREKYEKETAIKRKESSAKGKETKQKENSEHGLIIKLIKEQEEEKKGAETLGKSQKMPTFPLIKELPTLKKRNVDKVGLETESFGSILECEDKRAHTVTEMIKGTRILHYDSISHAHNVDRPLHLPMLYKVKVDLTTPMKNIESLSSYSSEDNILKPGKTAQSITSGIMRYELSNRKFIKKGWTKLPSTKIMRRMNIYKMLPASTFVDWFKIFKKNNMLFYETQEKLAEIYDTGSGKWFYKDGNIALEVYKEKAATMVKRYIVYSSVEDAANCAKGPITILACFDYLGNGVVYDHYGSIRLKYNQSEGLVRDKQIAPPGRWKWHTLNDPPLLTQVFINTYDKSEIGHPKDISVQSEHQRKANEDMIAIELDNFMKEKANKLLQKFKPFQIRMKVLKINKFFSLRIIDQANIFLQFRCDKVSLRINIGMLLQNDEIIDTEIAEVSDVSTPYDIYPPKTQSLINIQNTLNNVRKWNSSKRSK